MIYHSKFLLSAHANLSLCAGLLYKDVKQNAKLNTWKAIPITQHIKEVILCACYAFVCIYTYIHILAHQNKIEVVTAFQSYSIMISVTKNAGIVY